MAARSPQMIGESPLFHALLDRTSDLAALEVPILVMGARGTGKELFASRLHFLSSRWEQTYIRVNCAEFGEDELLIEIFGDERTNGRLLSADEGTLFLDNIETASLSVQEKLSRAVEDGEFEADESSHTQSVNVRFLFASGADLPALTKAGKFSQALLDRMAFETLPLPPLRDRRADIAPLSTYFGRQMASKLGADRYPGLTPEAIQFLMEQPWPGNVRELKNVVDRTVANAFLRDETLSEPIHDIRFNVFPATQPAQRTQSEPETSEPIAPAELETTDFTDRVMTFERNLIDQALGRHDHHQGKAAEYLGLSYHQFRGLLRKHGMKK